MQSRVNCYKEIRDPRLGSRFLLQAFVGSGPRSGCGIVVKNAQRD